MSLTDSRSFFAPFDQLPTGAFRLHRRSSCPSIPRSVSVCSSVLTFESSSEDLRIPADFDEVDMYMSPLFRGLGIGEADSGACKRASVMHTEGFTSRTTTIHYDDSLSESLSDYQFDMTGHEHVPEPPKHSEDVPSEQSPIPAHYNPSLVREESLSPEASSPLTPAHLPLPTLEDSPPPVPPKTTRPIIVSTTSTRPLQIDRSKKLQELSRTPRQVPQANVQYGQPSTKRILKTATQTDLRGAYRGANLLAERKVYSRGAIPVNPPSVRAHPKVPSPSSTEQVVVTTLFPTGLIPLEHARDKFKHAHCLEPVPPRPNRVDPPTSSPGHHLQRIRGWSFSRAFKKQKA